MAYAQQVNTIEMGGAISAEDLVSRGEKLFTDRLPLMTYWQNIAEMFYPERADFITSRHPGHEPAEGLATGIPLMVRRDLGDSLGSMLRPSSKPWFHPRVDKWDLVGSEARAWLEMAEERQRRAMYHKDTGFSRAVKEADHDFATFGQAVIQISVNRRADGMLYRCWHLRDVAWMENAAGRIDCVYRRWRPHAVDLKRMFPETISKEVSDICMQRPYEQVDVLHIILPADMYQPGERTRYPWYSIHVEKKTKKILEAVNIPQNEYTIARWQTVSGSQYAYSPAVVVAMADARTLQEMTTTLLEAGEKAVTPPLLGVQGALRSDVNVMAGGITWVDYEYDERLGEVLRPLTQDMRGIPLGLDMSRDLRQQLAEAFYINKLSLPPLTDGEMTAYEVSQRTQEYIRHAMPLFEPIETEYNAPLCDTTFSILLRFGVFGPAYEIPRELQGREIEFTFESPLHDAIERAKGQRFLEATSLVSTAVGGDQSSVYVLDVKKGLRDALQSSGVPAAWLRTEAEVDAAVKRDTEQQEAQQFLEQMQQGANVAKTIGLTPAPSGTGNTGAAGI